VFIPYLGKISVKHREQQFKDYIHTLSPIEQTVLRNMKQDELDIVFAYKEEAAV